MDSKKKRNSLALIIRGIAAVVIIVGIGIAVAWIISEERKSDEIHRQECLRESSKTFKGVIRSVNHYEWNEHMSEKYFGIHIKLSDTSSINYMFEKEHHKELSNFIQPHDSVIKYPGTDSFIVVKDDGLARHFVVPECGE